MTEEIRSVSGYVDHRLDQLAAIAADHIDDVGDAIHAATLAAIAGWSPERFSTRLKGDA